MKSKCTSHEDIVTRITRIEANTDQILIKLDRLEERMYATHGVSAGTARSFGVVLKVVGIAAATGTVLFAAIKLATG